MRRLNPFEQLVRRAVAGELSQREATVGLCWLYGNGLECPELEALLLPIAGDEGLARALAAQNARAENEENLRGEQIESHFRTPWIREASGSETTLTLSEPLVFRSSRTRLEQLAGVVATAQHELGKAASAELAPPSPRSVIDLNDRESGLGLRVVVSHHGQGEAALALDLFGAPSGDARAEVREAVAEPEALGALVQSGELSDFLEPVLLPVGSYQIGVFVVHDGHRLTFLVAFDLQLGS